MREPSAFNRNKDTAPTALAACSYKNAMADENLFYVAISLARSEVMLSTDDRDLLPAAVGLTNNKVAALNLRIRDSAPRP